VSVNKNKLLSKKNIFRASQTDQRADARSAHGKLARAEQQALLPDNRLMDALRCDVTDEREVPGRPQTHAPVSQAAGQHVHGAAFGRRTEGDAKDGHFAVLGRDQAPVDRPQSYVASAVAV